MSQPQAALAPLTGALIRPLIRPLAAHDEDTVAAVFEGLTSEQRQQRFHVAMPRLPAGVRRWLSDVDGRDRVALVAWLGEDPVGIARYYRTSQQSAEAAVAVVGRHTRRGIGGALVDALAEHASLGGVGELVFDIIGTNAAALHLVRSRGAALGRPSSTVHGVVALSHPLPPVRAASHTPNHARTAA